MTYRFRNLFRSVSDLDSIRSVDPGSGTGSRKAKMTHKKWDEISCFEVLDVLF